MKEEIIQLVEQAKNGDERSFNKLYTYYKQTIWYTIYNIVKNVDVTDDLLSVVFTKAYERLSSYIQHISFEMWLKTIAINSSIDYIRRNKQEQLNNYIDDEDCKIQLDSCDNSPEDKLVITEKLKLVQEAMTTLQKKYRNLIELRLEGKSYKDIAEELALSESRVKSDLNKARQQLKKKISKIY